VVEVAVKLVEAVHKTCLLVRHGRGRPAVRFTSLLGVAEFVGQFLMTFKDYPQRQKASSFNMDEVLQKLKESGGSK
jgi:hypothetical protein